MSWDNPRFIKTPPGYNSAMSEDTEKTQSDSVEVSESKEIFDYDAYISKHPDFKNLFEDCFKSSGLPEEKRDFVKNELIKNLEEKQDFTENEFKFTVENVIDDFASEYELNQQFTDYSLILNTLIELNKLDSFQVNILLIIQNYIPTIKRSRNIKYLTEMIYGECSENLEILFDYDSCIEKIDSKLSKANSKTLAKILYGELKTNTRPDVMKTEIKNRLKSMCINTIGLSSNYTINELVKRLYLSFTEDDLKLRKDFVNSINKDKVDYNDGILRDLNKKLPQDEEYIFSLKTHTSLDCSQQLTLINKKDNISLYNHGKGEQIITNVRFTIDKSENNMVLIEESENHLNIQI